MFERPLCTRLASRPKTGLGTVAALSLLLLATAPSAALATVYEVAEGDDWIAVLKGLEAGDTLVLAAGTYATGGKVDLNLQGTEAMPITVMGDPAGERPVIVGVSNQNTFDLGGAWYHFEYLEITGGSHGIRIEISSHGSFRDLKMHDLGDVGFSMNRTGHSYDNMHITHCEIYDTGKGAGAPGEGMYIGCNDGSCIVNSSRFDFNYVHDIGGSQGDGIEIKKNSWGNVVADNIVVNTHYPGITMYGYDAVAMPRNVVERNFVWQTWDNGIQVNGQVIVRNNIIIGAGTNGANGIHSKPTAPHLPNDVNIIHNTVINAGGVCLRTNNWDDAANQVVANNALYCPGSKAVKVVGNSASMTWTNNAVMGSVEGNSTVAAGTSIAGVSIVADFADAAALDVYPSAGSAVIDQGDASWGPTDDFNQTPRTDGAPDIGAFEWSASGNPQPVPGDGIKAAPQAPPADAGPESPADVPPEPIVEVAPESVAELAPEPMPEAGEDTAEAETMPEVSAEMAGPDVAPDTAGNDLSEVATDAGNSSDTAVGVDANTDTNAPPVTQPAEGCAAGSSSPASRWWLLGGLTLILAVLRRRHTFGMS